MRELKFDTGIEVLQVNDGAELRFNPSDPGLYSRFVAAQGKLNALEEQFEAEAREIGSGELDEEAKTRRMLVMLDEYDRQAKDVLTDIFGQQNDFDAILSGLSCFAVTASGDSVLANFLLAIAPIIDEGAQRMANADISKAVAEANANRAARRAAAKAK